MTVFFTFLLLGSWLQEHKTMQSAQLAANRCMPTPPMYKFIQIHLPERERERDALAVVQEVVPLRQIEQSQTKDIQEHVACLIAPNSVCLQPQAGLFHLPEKRAKRYAAGVVCPSPHRARGLQRHQQPSFLMKWNDLAEHQSFVGLKLGT